MAAHLKQKTHFELCNLLEDLRGFPRGIVIGTAMDNVLNEIKRRMDE